MGDVTASAVRVPAGNRRGGPRSISPLYYIILLALAVFSIGPIVLSLFASLKTQAELARNPIGLPADPQWGNFVEAFLRANMAAGFTNSLIVVGGTVVGVCLVSGGAAYAMTRLDLPATGGVMTYLLVTTAIPIQLFLVPLFFLWTRIGLYDTLFGIIVIYTAVFSTFSTLLLRSFMISIPREFDEAARMDGAGELTILFRVVLPMAWPGFLTVALIAALEAYNEFLLAATFLLSEEHLPVSISLYAFQEGFSQNYVLLSAGGLIMLAPMVIVFLLLQRRFVEGVASTGMTG